MRRSLLIAIATLLCAVTACTSSGPATSSAPPRSASASSDPVTSHASPPAASSPATRSTSKDPAATPQAASSTAAAKPSPAAQALAKMSEAQRVGQLLMIDCPSTSVSSTTTYAISHYHVGSVILDGNSTLSVSQEKALTSRLQSFRPKGVRLLISTDQEGGLVRRMRGPGFANIPSAVVQGGESLASLTASAKTWGHQLRAAGINVDLAPVMDTVPANSSGNPPIGDLDREYGRTPAAVSAHGTAVAKGLAAGTVEATIKHFPGLGRVAGNTDTTSGVKDTVTTRHDAYLAPFATAIKAHVPFVMLSTAIYTRIDASHPAAFSSTIVTGMLRGDLGFRGVIISDDLGAAKQVSAYSIGGRAVRFVQAGGNIVLTVVASQAKAMTAALLAKANSSATFRKQVDAAALTVLEAKQARGLLS